MQEFNSVEKHKFVKTHASLGGPGVTVGVAGMQSHGSHQFAPIVDSLPGDVLAYNAIGRRFNPEELIDNIVIDLEPYVENEDPVRFVGASMGGMLTPFIIQELRNRYEGVRPETLQALIVDAPSGLESMANRNAYLLGNRAIASALESIPPWVTAPVWLPANNEITVPSTLLSSPDNYKNQVRRSTAQRLSGFALSLWADKINWMASVGRNGTLKDACRSHDQVDTTYVVCTRRNKQVKQPRAVEDWDRWVDSRRAYVNAGHCAFHQNNEEFVEFFDNFDFI